MLTCGYFLYQKVMKMAVVMVRGPTACHYKRTINISGNILMNISLQVSKVTLVAEVGVGEEEVVELSGKVRTNRV